MTTPGQLSDTEITARDSAYWLPYAAFWAVTLLPGDNITWAIGPDPLETVPYGYPYPTTGLNLGKILGRLKIRKGVKREDKQPEGLRTTSRGATFSEYKRVYEFRLAATKRRAVTDLFDDPATRTTVDSYGGGGQDPYMGVLVLLFADDNNPGDFMGLINFAASPDPTDEEFGSDDLHEIDAVFHCYAGDKLDEPGCQRDAPGDTWRRIYIRADSTYYNPDTGEDLPPDATPDAYGALMMSGMMG